MPPSTSHPVRGQQTVELVSDSRRTDCKFETVRFKRARCQDDCSALAAASKRVFSADKPANQSGVGAHGGGLYEVGVAGVGDRMVLAEVAVGEDRVARAAHVRAADAPASQSPIHVQLIGQGNVPRGCDSKRVKRSSAVRNADRIIELCIDRSIKPSSAFMME